MMRLKSSTVIAAEVRPISPEITGDEVLDADPEFIKLVAGAPRMNGEMFRVAPLAQLVTGI